MIKKFFFEFVELKISNVTILEKVYILIRSKSEKDLPICLKYNYQQYFIHLGSTSHFNLESLILF